MTPTEKAYLETGQGNPYPEEKLELPKEESGAVQPEPTEQPASEAEQPTNEADAETAGADGEKTEEEGEEEVEVVNKEGETRRKMIAFGAYEKKRIEVKRANEELTKLREQVAYLNGLQQSAKPAPQQQPTAEAEDELLSPVAPDKAKHPERYLAWLEASDRRAIARMEKQAKQQSEQVMQSQNLNQTVYEHEQAFVKGDPEAGIEPHPDFLDAINFLKERTASELKLMGHSPHEVQQIVTVRAQAMALNALQKGESPAKRAYELAKFHGYKKAAPVVKETEAEKIARQAKNQEKAGKNISDLPGGESKGGLTAETLANMDPKEFLKKWTSGEAKSVMGWTE